MAAWRDEFDQRCRRVLGVTDDSIAVHIETNWGGGGCDTCGYGGEGSIEVSAGSVYKAFNDLGDLIRKLDEVAP